MVLFFRRYIEYVYALNILFFIGCLGHGNDSSVAVPQLCVSFLQQNIKIIQIAAGGNHSLAIDNKNNVYSWGDGSKGILIFFF